MKMKNKRGLILKWVILPVIFLLPSFSPAVADEKAPPEKPGVEAGAALIPANAVADKPVTTAFAGEEIYQKHTFEITPEISHREYDESNLNMHEKGTMYGLAGSYTYHNNFMLKIEGTALWGNVDYNSPSGVLNGIPDAMYEIRGLAGYDIPVQSSAITPYIGFGYRYLSDDSSGKTTNLGAKGYLREISYQYMPLGVTGVTKFDNGWAVEGNIEYDIFLRGDVNTHFSDAFPILPDVTNSQSSGYGVRGSIDISKKYGQFTYVVGIFDRYWNIDRSDTTVSSVPGVGVFTSYEPKNNSNEVGLNFGVRF